MEDNTLEILKTINNQIDVKSLTSDIAELIVVKGLSYRQACAVLEYTKDRLQDARLV
jgi:ribosomal silencing factor RsfS